VQNVPVVVLAVIVNRKTLVVVLRSAHLQAVSLQTAHVLIIAHLHLFLAEE